MQHHGRRLWKSRVFQYIENAMSRDSAIRLAIIVSLLAGYVVVAVLRSGTAW